MTPKATKTATKPTVPPELQCIIKGCGREILAKGLCRPHYDKSRKGRDLSEPIRGYGTGGKVPMPTPKLPKEIADWYAADSKKQDRSMYEIINEILIKHAKANGASDGA